MSELFTPKAGGEPWTADLHETHEESGYDVVLFLDKIAKTDDSGWMLELAVEKDGTIAGQITAHPGYDPLVVFTCTQDTLSLWEGSTEPSFVITDGVDKSATSTADKLKAAVDALRILTKVSAYINSVQHARLDISPTEWSDLYAATNAAKAVLDQLDGG